MPLIKPRTHRVKRVRHTCSLVEPMRDVLMQYARFIGDSPDYVLNTLIEVTLAKDRDFIAWRERHVATSAAPTPRVEGAAPARARTGASA